MQNSNADITGKDASALSAPDLLDTDDADEMDVEMALLALSSRDMGEPTEDVDLSVLSDAEKRALLALLRQRLHLPPSVSPAPETGEGATNL